MYSCNVSNHFLQSRFKTSNIHTDSDVIDTTETKVYACSVVNALLNTRLKLGDVYANEQVYTKLQVDAIIEELTNKLIESNALPPGS